MQHIAKNAVCALGIHHMKTLNVGTLTIRFLLIWNACNWTLGWGTLNESSTVIVWHNETVMSLSQGSSPAFPWEKKE